MSEIVIRDIGERVIAVLQERARKRGIPLEDLIREVLEADALLQPSPARPEPPHLSEEERQERHRLAAQMAEFRRRTLKPATVDSSLLIREDRDTR